MSQDDNVVKFDKAKKGIRENLVEEVDDPVAELLESDDPAGLSKLAALNKKHAFIRDYGGRVRISTNTYDNTVGKPVLSFIGMDDFKAYYCNQTMTVGKSIVDLGSWWLKHPHRREYGSVVFSPGQPSEYEGCLNLWRGFHVTAERGSWQRTKRHLYKILCNGDSAKFKYVIKWLAWAIQNPHERAGVAVIFKGKQGAGKGFIFTQMCKIFGEHGLAIANREHLTGRFSGHLKSVCFLFADEAYYPGDKEIAGVLNQIITEEILMLEEKNLTPRKWRNCLHIGMATNSEWVIPATTDSRRFFINAVDNRYAKNSCPDEERNEYFQELWGEMDSGGREAMFYDLLNMQLGKWRPVSDIPHTEELDAQIDKSIDKPKRLIMEFINSGIMPGHKHDRDSYATTSRELMDQLEAISPGHRIAMQAIIPILKRIGCTPKTIQNKRCWIFEELSVVKDKWNEAFGKFNYEDRNTWTLANTSY